MKDVESNLSLRPVTTDDLGLLVNIEEQVQKVPWSRDQFQSELDKPYSTVLVLTDDDTDQIIYGYIVYWTLHEEAQILNLAIGLEHRGQGFAQRILRAAINDCQRQGALELTLEVRKSNHAATELYQKVGFYIHSVRKSFYSDGEDAYHMQIDLVSGPKPL